MSVPTRLHVTPLTPDLLPIVLGPNLISDASNVSFQTLATFPENDYGFLDLPLSQANRLIAKVNGAILKGRKMKIEVARSKKRPHDNSDNELQPSDTAPTDQTHKRSRRARKENGVIEAHELPSDRKVKRGWTEPSSERLRSKRSKAVVKSKYQAPSKYTEKQELLFRTKLPLNKEDLVSKKTKKPKSGKKSSTSPTLVHEFEKTTIQPSFLRENATSSKKTAEFIDGKGWVDANGNVVEKEPLSLKQRRNTKAVGLRIDFNPSQPAEESPASPESTSSSGSSSASLVSKGSMHTDPELEKKTTSNDSSSTDSDLETPPKSKANDRSFPQIQVQPAPETPPKVHPLEALFKKPRTPSSHDSTKPTLEIETSFSFFGNREAEESDALPPMPVTPFTSQDVHARGVRSAAPTPDTAHPSRFASFANALAGRGEGSLHNDDEDDDDDIDNDDDDSNHTSTAALSDLRSQSEFEKRFWAERGQNNRAWKARSRASRKEQRQMENRLHRSKNAR